MTRRAGGCHCGALTLEFETDAPLAPRACQCSFCKQRGARWVSDPAGSATLELGPEAMTYRFATGTADFVLCSRCGTCIAALQDAALAVLNLNAFDDPREDLPGEPTNFDGETSEGRTARRRARWTPTRIIAR